MKHDLQRGDIAIFAEVLVVVALIFGFLIALKSQTKHTPAAGTIDATSVYPHSSTAKPVAEPSTAHTYQQAAAPQRTTPYEINYSDLGFVPSITEIYSQNRVVVFRNKSKHAIRIVDETPSTDPKFPNLTAPIDTPPGGVYWFAFPAGKHTYNFRNKLKPTQRGVIIIH